MGEKVFKTYEEQLDILKNRGMVFSNGYAYRKAKNIIQREGYYKLINGYKSPFLARSFPDEHFLQGTTLDEIQALYTFDMKLREIFLRHILIVETNIKTLISYVISENYGHDNYLLYKNFNTYKSNANKEISKVIADVQQSISKNYNDPCIQHYLKNYGYIPMWVLNNVLTLGNVSRLYSIMKTKDRQDISKIFKIQDNTLESFLLTLSIVRNFSAHGNRLYCFRSKRPVLDTELHKNLNIPKEKGEYIYGKRDLFAAVISLRYLLSVNNYLELENELKNEIAYLSPRLKVIDINKILLEMGFPTNWELVSEKNMK